VTVFVGPNNSGKSTVLTEIAQYCNSGHKNAFDVILDTIEFEKMSAGDAERHIQSITLKPNARETLHPDHVIVGSRGNRQQVPKKPLLAALQAPQEQVIQFCRWYLTYNTLILNGKNRIDLVNQQPAGDLQAPPHASLQVLFKNDEKRAEVRRIIHDAFGF